MNKLKMFRVAIATLTIVITTLLFLNFHEVLSGSWDEYILSFQFVPSMLKLIKGASYIAIGFVGFTLLAFVFGRVYCSFICPLGILQDVFIRLSKRFNKKRKYSYKKPVPWLRFVIFALVFVSLFFSSSSLLLIFDPYSNFGRIATHQLQPLFLLLNNFIAHVGGWFDYYGIYHVDLKAFHIGAFLFSFIVTLTLIVLTFRHGRLFCNTLCPVGTFLGKLSTISIFKLKFLPDNCIQCGKCEHACKSECVDFKDMKIDFDRCVTCYNCISVCPTNAIAYKLTKKESVSAKVDKTRRTSIKTMGVAVFSAIGLSARASDEVKSNFISELPANSEFPVTPPGSISLEYFKSACTACHLCVSSCPTNVIQSTFAEYGIDGLFLPKLDYDVNYCQYECSLCGDVCPTGAILPLNREQKVQTQIGKVVFIEDNCVVSNNEEDCGACAEHCPTKAVHMVPYKDKLYIPEVDTDICIGCGACEHPCPVRPHKAIFVESNTAHQLAQLPEIKKVEQQEQVDEEFPF